MWKNTTRSVLRQLNRKKAQEPAENLVPARGGNTRANVVFSGGAWSGIESYGPDIGEVTYFTVLRILSETVGKLPIFVRDKEHNIVNNDVNWRLTVRPNEKDTPTSLMSYLEYCRIHYGNGYALCDWNPKTGGLNAIHPLDPHRVRIWVDNVTDAVTPKFYYTYDSVSGRSFILPNEDVIHVKNWHVDDLTGLIGIPVRETLQEYMNAAKGGQKTQNDMYKQGMVASGVLSFIGDLKDDDMQEMLDYTQKIGKSQRIIPLPDGWKLTPVNLSLADSQYLETRRYTALQIAAAFGVSPNQLNDYSKGSYSNSVAQEQAFLTGALQYISRVYENEMSLKLLSDDELAAGVHIDMDTDAMLKNTPETMAKILKDMAGGSVMMINEARNMAGLPPIPGGNVLFTVPGSEQVGGEKTNGDADDENPENI